MALLDSVGRRINYLRLSVTDRCNLRCVYCMPAEGVPKLCHGDVLSYEDMYRVVGESVALGVEKVRVTGGEPLIRRGLVGFVERLASIAGLKEIVLTTNGMLLTEFATPLLQAGLHRLNISLDSLKPETFATITRGGDLQKVLNGLAAAEAAGFPPVKINMVVMRGVNDGEVLNFAELSLHKPYTVRFIEYMPTVKNADWKSLCVSGCEILERIGQRHALAAVPRPEMAGPAKNYRISGAAGTIGIITPMSDHFCESCNRVRITASGFATGCLFGGGGIDLKPFLKREHNLQLRNTLRQIIVEKPIRHRLNDEPGLAWTAMSQIGG
jgi:cyclic pyranopterin phosphate synthase